MNVPAPSLPKASFRLVPGDRAPNFSLPDHSGKLQMFYEETRGAPILLYFHDNSPEALTGLEQIAGPRTEAAVEFQVFAISNENPGAASEPVRSAFNPVIRLLDPLGRIRGAYCAAAGMRPPALFVLDANQRLIAAIRPAPGVDLARQAEAAFSATVKSRLAAVHVELAPVLMLPRVLDDKFCARLIQIFETEGHEEGVVMSTVSGKAADRLNYGAKKRLDHWVTDVGLARELNGLLGPRFGAEVHRAFHFDGFWLEQFCIVCYDADRGDFFRPHRDNLIPELASRRFAATINLNDDYEGGGLRFPEYGPHLYRPPAGGAILFSSSLLHEAVPVKSGRRFALLTFLRTGTPQNRQGGPAPS